MSEFYIKQGDTLPVLTATATNEDGSPLDVTGATITFRMRGKAVSGFVIESTADIIDAAAGVLQWADWTTTQTAEPGVYFADFLVVFSGGGRQTVPTKGSIIVRVIGAAAGDCEA